VSQFMLVEYTGREQPWTVWEKRERPMVCYFAATQSEAQRWVDDELELQRLTRKAWRT